MKIIRLSFITSIVVLLSGVYPLEAFSRGCGHGFTPRSDDVVEEEKVFHPAGPTLITKFSRSNAEKPYRVEARSLKSGTTLLDHFRFKLVKDVWTLMVNQGQPVKLYKLNNSKKVTVKSENQTFEISVLSVRYHVTVPSSAGYADESEPSIDVDINLCR
jgi:hypothetical protein